MDKIFSLADIELMLDCVYFASEYIPTTYTDQDTPDCVEIKKRLDDLFSRMVDWHDAMVNGGYNG